MIAAALATWWADRRPIPSGRALAGWGRRTHTNTIEGLFSVFKRGMKGVYQHCSKQHFHRHLAEFDFRYNARQITDVERAAKALQGITGIRGEERRAVPLEPLV